ncbi:MAG: hypothetical protein JRI22_22945 [Deltaproteobacteria bacterium]|nr:hypothetical protein [Deltaproteobacteria bacterium]
MIVEARVVRTNITKDIARLDLFTPRFRMKPLMHIHIGFEGQPVKFFTEWEDLPNKEIKINKSPLPEDKFGKVPLIRGSIYCCKDNNTVFIHMPKQLIK